MKTRITKVIILGLAAMLLISSAAVAALKPAEVTNKALVNIDIISKITIKEKGAVQDVDATSKASVVVGKVKLWPYNPLKGKITMQSASSANDMTVSQYVLELDSVNYGGNYPPVSFTEGIVTVKETNILGNIQTTVTVSDIYIY